MIRFLVRTCIFLASAAIGLLVAASILDDVHVTAEGFVITVAIYAVVQSIMSPFLLKVAAINAKAFLGGIGLLATFVALIVADMFGDALDISGGLKIWILATLIVWLTTAVATILLPFALVKAGIESARAKQPS